METSLHELQSIAEIISSIMIIVGVPLSVFKYWQAKNRERNESEYKTYDVVDEKYIQFQQLCFQHPRLDIGPTPNVTTHELTEAEKKQEMLAFTILLSLFERTFIMYSPQSTEMKESQWKGWEQYLGEYCRRENFRRAWKLYGYSYDVEFQKRVDRLIKEHSVKAPRVA